MSGMKRPDIASAVGAAVAQYAYNPPVRHWKAVRKTITYLKATKDMRVMFRRGEDLELSLLADVNNADRCKERRSVLDVAVMLGNTVLSAGTTTQHCVTPSTTKAE